MNSQDIIRELMRDGWEHVRTRGSHWQFRHPDKPGLVTIPHPRRDLARGTLRSIEKQSGLKLR
jgi:predicted RNA binding protein YcfA (HicA-like mRNA interferase family)